MRRIRVSLWVSVACLGLAGAIAAGPAEAQQIAPGVQAGVSVDPDQFYFGGHIETSPLIDRLRFRPNVDIGIGDATTGRLQPRLHVHLHDSPSVEYLRWRRTISQLVRL